MEPLEVTWQAIHARREWDEGFARRVDAALMEGRSPWISHGEDRGYRFGCRCPECREAHGLVRGGQPRR